MEQAKQQRLSRLPARTWNRLGVNDIDVNWDEEKALELPRESYAAEGDGETLRLCVQGEGEYASREIEIEAKPGASVTVYQELRAENALRVRTRLTARENARIRLVQVQDSREDSLLLNDVSGLCEKDARIELIQAFAGKGDFFSDSRFQLREDGATFAADIGYLGRGRQRLDMNLIVDHYGKRTESEIEASGALKDAARKTFRGTIDFKQGSADSVGNENETVLLLGEDVRNQTVPLILCAEENVVGNHGATIGELDEDTLFYFESRGIGKEQAENILARAALERLARKLGDEETAGRLIRRLDEELEG